MKKEHLFPEGFSLEGSQTTFKVLPVNVEITELKTYQNALIELIQGFSLYTNVRVEKNNCYDGWVTDKPETIYYGLEVLKAFMLSKDQLNELQISRERSVSKKEKKRKKEIKRVMKKLKKRSAEADEEIAQLLKDISDLNVN